MLSSAGSSYVKCSLPTFVCITLFWYWSATVWLSRLLMIVSLYLQLWSDRVLISTSTIWLCPYIYIYDLIVSLYLQLWSDCVLISTAMIWLCPYIYSYDLIASLYIQLWSDRVLISTAMIWSGPYIYSYDLIGSLYLQLWSDWVLISLYSPSLSLSPSIPPSLSRYLLYWKKAQTAVNKHYLSGKLKLLTSDINVTCVFIKNRVCFERCSFVLLYYTKGLESCRIKTMGDC